MVKNESEEKLSKLLKAVSDSTRRTILTQICQQGPSRVTDLAQYYDMSLNAVSKHIKILEHAELIRRHTIGRTHWIEANLENFQIIEQWFESMKTLWESRLDTLNDVLNIDPKKDNGDIENE